MLLYLIHCDRVPKFPGQPIRGLIMIVSRKQHVEAHELDVRICHHHLEIPVSEGVCERSYILRQSSRQSEPTIGVSEVVARWSFTSTVVHVV